MLSYKSTVPSYCANICLASVGATSILSSGKEQDTDIFLSPASLLFYSVSVLLQHRFEDMLLSCLAAFKVGTKESISRCLGSTTGLSWPQESIDPTLPSLYLCITDLQQFAQNRQRQGCGVGESVFIWLAIVKTPCSSSQGPWQCQWPI